jgi:hypothetical protein
MNIAENTEVMSFADFIQVNTRVPITQNSQSDTQSEIYASDLDTERTTRRKTRRQISAKRTTNTRS